MYGVREAEAGRDEVRPPWFVFFRKKSINKNLMIIKHLMVIHAKTLFCVEIGPARAGGAARARTEHARFVFQNPFFVGENKIPSRKILLKRRIFNFLF